MPATTLLMLPPQTKLTHQWAERLALDVPDVSVIVAEDAGKAARAIAEADCAYGTLPRAYLPRQLNREWRPAPLDTSVIHLPEATALIVGVGGIGAEAARLAAAFGMRVLAVDARRRDAPAGVAALYGADALDSVLPGADFVILTVPHTPATEGFMNRARFQRMKRTAFFINIRRGMTTRLDDLVAALKAGEIAGAGLDVFEQEPLPTEHPLWTMPGVLITPHTAGFGPYLDDRRYEILRDNCQRFLAGQPLRNVVDKTSWF